MNPYWSSILLATLFFFLAGGPGTAGPDPTDLPQDDFVQAAFLESLWREEAGSIAARQAASKAVRSFGERMAQRYSTIAKLLRVHAGRTGRVLMEETDQLQKNTLEHLRRMQGASLDREYMNLMLNELERDQAVFRRQAEQGQDRETTGIARHTAGLFEGDLKVAQDILKDLPFSGYSAPSPSGGSPPEIQDRGRL